MWNNSKTSQKEKLENENTTLRNKLKEKRKLLTQVLEDSEKDDDADTLQKLARNMLKELAGVGPS